MKKEGEKGAGVPVSRGTKRKEKVVDRRQAKREKEREHMTKTSARVVDLLENPRESEADVVFIGLATELRAKTREDAIRAARAALLQERELEKNELQMQYNLLRGAKQEEEATMVMNELLALLRSPLPEPSAPAPIPTREPRTGTKTGVSAARAGQGGESIDLTAPDGGRFETGGEISGSGEGAAGGIGSSGEEEEEDLSFTADHLELLGVRRALNPTRGLRVQVSSWEPRAHRIHRSCHIRVHQ
ncbi:unnamed protein product [Pylaiella littoralis]